MFCRKAFSFDWLVLTPGPTAPDAPTLPELLRATLPLFLAHFGLLALFDLGSAPRWTVLTMTLGFAAWAFAARGLVGKDLGIGHLVGIAALLRLVLLPLPPTLSDDTLRYVWDGKVLLAGFNPYALAPESTELMSLRDELWRKMPHQQVPSVYPPLAMALFAAAATTHSPLFTVKLLICLADLLGIWWLLRLAKAQGLPTGRVLLYAWNPLVVLEVAGMGHIDALMVAATIAAVFFLHQKRDTAAGIAAAAAVAAKILPILAIPLWWRRASNTWRFTLATVLGLALLALPLFSRGSVPPGLKTYGVSWEWNGPLYEPLWRVYDALDLVPWVKARLDDLKQFTQDHETINRLYPMVYPQFLAKLTLLAVLALLLLALFRRRPDPSLAAEASLGAFLLCSATVYPWYLLGVLPWAALAGRRVWFLLSFTMVFSYLPQKIAGLHLFPGFYLVVWLPFFVSLAFSLLCPQSRSTQP